MPPKVGLCQGDDRKENITRVLRIIEDEIKDKIVKKRRVVLKPNLGFIKTNLANTQVEAVEAVLEFLREFYNKKIVIAEGTTIGETPVGFSDYGYEKLIDKYNVELFDINDDEFQEFKIYDGKLELKTTIGLSETILKSDYIISVCPIKTHDSVIVTLGIKNLVVGAIRRKDRSKIHVGPKAINLSLAKIAKKIYPSLTILDGYKAMEGSGPVHGERVDFKVALAGTDPVATDTMATILMGFNPLEIGYLYYCANQKMGIIDPLKISVIGENYRRLIRRFRPHHLYNQQLDWKI